MIGIKYKTVAVLRLNAIIVFKDISDDWFPVRVFAIFDVCNISKKVMDV